MSKRLRSQSRERIAVVSAAIGAHCRLSREGAPSVGAGDGEGIGDGRVLGALAVLLLMGSDSFRRRVTVGRAEGFSVC
jgi:hypothetical protein